MRKTATKQEKDFIRILKAMRCIICNAPPPSEFHHICDTGRRLGHQYGLPLCKNCHRGNDGFSGINRGAWDKRLEAQLELCRGVYKKLGLVMPEKESKIKPRSYYT